MLSRVEEEVGEEVKVEVEVEVESLLACCPPSVDCLFARSKLILEEADFGPTGIFDPLTI